ncbi:hypothetical protein [Streptomyces diastatochromogenes]|uniref:DNA-binding protein n=1 Tax=Streptomyces diastatochromogenes TaxID=42236 RepID=A0A233SNJ5_STRDA|nr:hypothetical protein [Streptomyces diastatochromogenes]MCZ0986907.1 hypothetical protein [Streptomyces diastatochromogenes]OXY97220.1 hypothetical protein BEK98_09835 [Streptomyces diastatochromogenes]
MGLTRRLLTLLFAPLLALLPAPALGTGSASAVPLAKTLSIAQARSLPLGTVVTVQGSVTTPSGAFESSFGDKGFGLQDKTAGLYVSLRSDVHAYPCRHARVTGTLRDSSGLLTLVPADPSAVELRHTGQTVKPERVSTAGVGEATEGRLVKVVGRITQAPTSDLPYGYKLSVDDGSGSVLIFVNVQTGIDVSTLKPGQTVRVTGFSSQFGTHYEIDPRWPNDIKVVAA